MKKYLTSLLFFCSFAILLSAGIISLAENSGGGIKPQLIPVYWEQIHIPGAGCYQAPLPSSDGKYLALSTEKWDSLWLYNILSKSMIQLSDQQGSGFRARWSPSGSLLAYRAGTGGMRPKYRIIVAHTDGVKETASILTRDLSLPVWNGRNLYYVISTGGTSRLKAVGPDILKSRAHAIPYCSPDGALWLSRPGKALQRIATPSKEVFSLPVLSSDGNSFVVECLDGHLYLGRTDGGELLDIGPGSYASFVRDDSALLFERTGDDGHEITSSDIYLLELDSMKLEAVTDTPDIIERRPSMASDGRTVYYDSEGKIFRGVLP